MYVHTIVCMFACVNVCTISIAVCACIARLLDDGALLCFASLLAASPTKYKIQKKIIFSTLCLFFSLALSIYLSLRSSLRCVALASSSCLLALCTFMLCFICCFVVRSHDVRSESGSLALCCCLSLSHSYSHCSRLHCLSLFIERQRSPPIAPHTHPSDDLHDDNDATYNSKPPKAENQ